MKSFLDDNFLLQTGTAQQLYHGFARDMPVIDYHCHLPPDQIAGDHRFANLTEAWLQGDHYKWRAMRTNGVSESYCTGAEPDREKFRQWAATVPYTLRNPLYHWTHLELRRYFGVNDILSPATADEVYDHCSHLLRQPEYSVRNLLRRMNVEIVCTTDDPIDPLEHHRRLRDEGSDIRMLPAFRPDKAMQVADPAVFNTYVAKLEAAAGKPAGNFQQYLDLLLQRHDYFAEMGCSVSDHGLEQMDAADYREQDVAASFADLRAGRAISPERQAAFRSAMLHTFALWDHEKGWVQQYHLGALRNNNSRMMRLLGPDTGWDSIGDFPQAASLAKFLDRLDRDGRLTKTILYNLNPSDNEVIATMAGNFNDGSTPGKIQFGSGWWFLDQQEGMERQLNALSNMGLISRFVGMLTDSRSFLSFPRHEYFRRILCNLLGNDVENGALPHDLPWIGKVVQDICYHNAAGYFGWGKNPG